MKRKLDEMMRDFNVKQGDLQFNELSELERRRVLEQTLRKAGLAGAEQKEDQEGDTEMRQEELKIGTEERIRKTRMRRRCIAVGVAATLAVGAVGVSAATGLSEKIMEFLKPTNEKQEALLTEAGTVIDKKALDNGTTLIVRESVGDRNSVYVLFDLIAPEGTILDQDNYSFERTLFGPGKNEQGPSSMGYGVELLKDKDPKDNRISFVLQADSGDGVQGKEMKLELENLKSYSIEKGDYENVLSGNWKVEFALNYRDISKSHKVEKDVPVYGKTAKTSEIVVSPLSLSVIIHGKVIADYDKNPPMLPENATDEQLDQYNKTYNITMEAVMKDGTKLEMTSMGTGTQGDELVVTGLSGQMIEVGDLKAVVVNGVEIPIK